MASSSGAQGGRSQLLAVFVRLPEPGRVKTRLAAAIGDAAAADLYAAFIADLARTLADPGWATRWWVAPPDTGFARRFGIEPADCRLQRGDDLGVRMRNAFDEARAEGHERCVLIGSDMPHLGRDRVAEAFARLDHGDLVLGPADDGGYYLIAMREPRDVFSGVAWSTASVLDATVASARAQGLVIELLDRDFDVDDRGDLARLQALLRDPGARDGLPNTARALAALGADAPKPPARH